MKRFLDMKTLTVGLAVFCIVSLTGCGGGNPTPVYHAVGVGVIMQSRSDITLSVARQKNNSNYISSQAFWKEVNLPLNGVSRIRTQSSPEFRTAAVTDTFLSENVSFICLNWDRVNGADRYQVLYKGEKVWDSLDTHPDDPTYKPNNPQAYLDLASELDGKISSAGDNYKFQIIAFNGSAEVARLPEVTASLGMHLEELPKSIAYTAPNLTWKDVKNVHDYILTFKKDENTNPIVVNNCTTTTYDVSSNASIITGDYEVWIDARYLDGNGAPIEITRGIGGFTYQ